MLASPRSALLVLAALSASSVAPAQVGPAAEPLLPFASLAIPETVVPQALPQPKAVFAPSETGALPVDELALSAAQTSSAERNEDNMDTV